MYELIMIILTVATMMLLFNLQKATRDAFKRVKKERKDFEAMTNATDPSEQRTIELVGEEEYVRMTTRIERILRRHMGQQAATLPLTCGPDTRAGARELHSILPGEAVSLTPCTEKGVEMVDVYSSGARIGRLALAESEIVNTILQTNNVRGVYVAEQNCFGIEDSYRLSIIMFFVPKTEDMHEQQLPRPDHKVGLVMN